MYESSQCAVRLKQQTVEFHTDFSIPILKEFIVTRSPTVSTDVVPTESDQISVIPISIRLNRRGLIDSEVIAVGKMLIPVKPNLVDNLQVGLMTSEDNTEIALATISVQVQTFETDASDVYKIIEEIESLMKEYTRQENQDSSIYEIFQNFLSSTSIVREIWSMWWSLLTWESYTNSLLFLITILAHPWGVFVGISFTIFYPISREKPVPFLSFLRLPPRGELHGADTLLQKNLECLSQIMQVCTSASQMIHSVPSEYLLVLLVVLFLIPYTIHVLIVGCMLCNTFWFQGVIRYIHTRGARTNDRIELGERNSFTVYEQQRWWLGKWSEKLLGKESVAWLDPRSGVIENSPRETFTLPQQKGYKWSGPWQAETGSMTDNDGWQYAKDFNQKFWSPRKEIRDFVRRRKWSRQYSKTD